jgi:hypothetical membrane protein
MSTPQGRQEPGSRAVAVLGYAVLFLLGVFQGLIGSFNYSQGPVPLVAIILDLAIFATCVLGGWGMRSGGAALLSAAGWMIASFVMSMGNAEGTVIITATTAGEWYLYGGLLAAAAGVAGALVATRSRPRPR